MKRSTNRNKKVEPERNIIDFLAEEFLFCRAKKLDTLFLFSKGSLGFLGIFTALIKMLAFSRFAAMVNCLEKLHYIFLAFHFVLEELKAFNDSFVA